EPDPATGGRHDLPATLTSQAPATRVQQHRIARNPGAGHRPLQLRAAAREVVLQRAASGPSDGDDALLVSFTEHAQQGSVEVHVAPVEPDELADSHTGRVERLEDRPVAQRPGAISDDRAEQGL